MKTATWLKHFRNRLAGHSGQRTIRRNTRLRLETLEERAVPATTVYFDDFVGNMTVDSAGNQYVNYSKVHGTVDLDPDPAHAYLVTGFDYTDWGSNTNGQFLVKYSPDRQILWVKSAAANELPFVNGVQIGWDAGIEYLYTFGLSITKMNLDGSVVWSTPTSPAISSIAIDTDGAIYGDGPGILLSKWAADGTFQWSRTTTVGGSGGVAVANGVVYVGGMYQNTSINIGGVTLTDDRIDSASTSPDGFLAAYDTNGNFQSVAHFIDAQPKFVRAVGSDVYLTAQFGYTADLDPTASQKLLTPGDINGENLAVARLTYNASPTPTWALGWAEKFVSNYQNTGGGLDVSGNALYVSGQFGGTTDFDPGSGTYNLTAGGVEDIFVMKLDGATGGLTWVTQMGSTRWLAVGPVQESVGLVLTPTGIYLGGTVAHGTVNFVGTDRTTNKIMDAGLDKDAFLAKLGTDGSYQWSFGVGAVGRTLDNGDIGYSESGSGWKDSSFGMDGDSRTHAKGTGSSTATWTFSGLQNGMYQVIMKFPLGNSPKRNASNAPFRVNGTLVTVDQTTAPNDIAPEYLEGVWENLGTFAVTNGTMTVVLSDAANGVVTADVVRIWFVAPPAPLLAASAPAGPPAAGALSLTTVPPLFDEALRRWQAAGVDTSSLHGIDIRIADLGGLMLGQASGHTITLDDNAAGWGWFVDRTPGDDSEFTTPGNQGERNRMDLLTVIEHEIGHVLGYEHEESGVMIDTLPAGTRRTPGSDASLSDFAQIDWLSAANELAPLGQRAHNRLT